MSKYTIEVTKLRWFRRPLVRTFTVTLDDDFGGMLWIGEKLGVNVKVRRQD
jgi:hypothetical protein